MGYNQNSGYGRSLLNMVASQVPTFGRVMVVMNSSNTDEENYQRMQEVMKADYKGAIRFYTNLETAYGDIESNNNDVILCDANSSHTLSTTGQLTVSNSRTHFVGMDGGDRLVQQGAKVQNATADTDSAILKVTGTRNSFKNLKFIQNSTNAAALNVAEMGGEGTLYKNCSFTFGVADNLDQTNAYEVVCGEDSGTFIDCQFGVDTLLTSAARDVFHIDQVTSSQEFKSNRFRGCNFLISSSSATAELLGMEAAGDILFTNLFEDCTFVASIDSAGGAALTRGMSTPNGVTKGLLLFKNLVGFGVTDLGVNGTNNDGIQVYGPSFTTGTDLVGLAPLAT